jgi:hypothetical protein
MFRNDYAFSIALHMMQNFGNILPVSTRLPGNGLLSAFDTDEIYDVSPDGAIIINAYNKETQNNLATRTVGRDIHIMNKWSLLKFADKLEGVV